MKAQELLNQIRPIWLQTRFTKLDARRERAGGFSRRTESLL